MQTIEIYTSPLCGYCHAAKRLLSAKGLNFVEFNVGRDPSKRAEMIQRAPGSRTVPQIFVGEIHVGGYDDMYALDKAGKFDQLVAA